MGRLSVGNLALLIAKPFRKESGCNDAQRAVMAPSDLTAKAACQQTVARVVGPAELLAETMQTALQFRKAALAVTLNRLGPALTASTVDTDFTASHLDTFAAPRSCRHCPSAERLGIPNISVAGMPAGLDAGRWALAL